MISVRKDLLRLLELNLGDKEILEFISQVDDSFYIDEIDDDVFFKFKRKGLEILFRNKKLDTIFFYLGENKCFDIPIFYNVSSVVSLNDVISHVSQGNLLYGGGEESVIGFIEPWVKFQTSDGVFVNIQYDASTFIIKLISLSLA